MSGPKPVAPQIRSQNIQSRVVNHGQTPEQRKGILARGGSLTATEVVEHRGRTTLPGCLLYTSDAADES